MRTEKMLTDQTFVSGITRRLKAELGGEKGMIRDEKVGHELGILLHFRYKIGTIFLDKR